VITFGTGDGDFVSVAGDLSGNTIRFGNGNNDYVTNVFTSPTPFSGLSSNNTIIMGNGTGDSVTLGGSILLPSGGGDTIVTGTGLDTVTVGTHTNADTFGIALGTGVVIGSSANYTTVTGAQQNDQVVA
jgi:hypothetical protein